MPPREVPIEALSFPAYRLADAFGVRRRPAAFQSLGHWFEAEKFRAFRPNLFDVVMLQPSVKEARKFATQHQPQWRGDWLGVRTRALACGMYYAWQADPAPERWMGSESDIVDLLAPLGLPNRFLPGVAAEFIRLRAAQRVVFLGAGAAPQDAVGRRVNMVHKKAERTWRLVHWQGRHGSWVVHDWALGQFVPIQYVGVDGARLAADHVLDLGAKCDIAVVFEARRGKDMDTVIRKLRACKTAQVELDLFAPSEPALLG